MSLAGWLTGFWSRPEPKRSPEPFPFIRPGRCRPVDYATVPEGGPGSCSGCEFRTFTFDRSTGRLTAKCVRCGALCPDILSTETSRPPCMHCGSETGAHYALCGICFDEHPNAEVCVNTAPPTLHWRDVPSPAICEWCRTPVAKMRRPRD